MNCFKKNVTILTILFAASSAFSIKIGSKTFTIKNINGGERTSTVKFHHDLHGKYLHWTNFSFAQNLVIPWVEKKILNEIAEEGKNDRFLIETTARRGKAGLFLERLADLCQENKVEYCNIDVRRPFIESFEDLLGSKETSVEDIISKVWDVKKEMDEKVEKSKNKKLISHWNNEMGPEIEKNIETLPEDLKPLVDKSNKMEKDVFKKCLENFSLKTCKLLDINALLEVDKELRKENPQNLHLCAGYNHTYNVSELTKNFYTSSIVEEEKKDFNGVPGLLNLEPKKMLRMLVCDQIDKYPLPRFVANYGPTIVASGAGIGLYFLWEALKRG